MTALAAVKQREENVADGAREGLRYGVKENIIPVISSQSGNPQRSEPLSVRFLRFGRNDIVV